VRNVRAAARRLPWRSGLLQADLAVRDVGRQVGASLGRLR